MSKYPFEKRIWIFWDTGVADAPAVVRLCVESWKRLNPTWTISVLSDADLAQFTAFTEQFDFARRDIDTQKKAALLRLFLLRQFGGVWIDATVRCNRSLDEWLPAASQSGFFAFRDPGPDRRSSNWFIAASRDNEILIEMERRFSELFEQNRFWLQNTAMGDRILGRLAPRFRLSAESTAFWLSFVARKILRVYPYFIFHYVFNSVVDSPALRPAWDAVPDFPADEPQALQTFKRRDQPEEAASHIRDGVSVVYKLNWRLDQADSYWAAVLQQLEAEPAT